MALKVKLDLDKIANQFKELAYEVKQDLEKGVGSLAAMTHAKVAEMANQELHSSRKDFQESLGFEEVAPGVWIVSVDEKGLWVEEGIEPNTDMKEGLLRNGAKTSKDGNKYKSIPFDHGKAPSQMTPYAQNLVSKIKYVLKKEGIPFKKIEKTPNGNPRLGKLHKLDIDSMPPTSRANTGALQGLTIYQSKTATGNVRRDIMTFRTVSSGPKSQGKWIHPGLKAKHFLERAEEWALKEWEEKILPEILKKY